MEFVDGAQNVRPRAYRNTRSSGAGALCAVRYTFWIKLPSGKDNQKKSEFSYWLLTKFIVICINIERKGKLPKCIPYGTKCPRLRRSVHFERRRQIPCRISWAVIEARGGGMEFNKKWTSNNKRNNELYNGFFARLALNSQKYQEVSLICRVMTWVRED